MRVLIALRLLNGALVTAKNLDVLQINNVVWLAPRYVPLLDG